MNWISVKKNLPKKFKRVLIFNKNKNEIERHGIHTAFIDNEKKWLFSSWHSLERSDDLITNWMPLPEQPEKEDIIKCSEK